MPITFKRLMGCILYLALMSIVQSQSTLDMYLDMPKIIPLQQDYVLSQSVTQQTHPFKIKFVQIKSGFAGLFSSWETTDRLYYITSFFYSLLIKVQHIPQSQTRFPIDSSGFASCFGVKVPLQYAWSGFSTKEQDIIIFTQQQQTSDLYFGSTESLGAGACVVERRPIYGLFSFQRERIIIFQDNANFHNTLIRVIHSTLHILGFNTNFIINRQLTKINDMFIHKDDQTLFFVNALSKQRLKVKDVIDLTSIPMIKTERVKKAVREIFQCTQSEQVGAALETVKDGLNNQYVRFHWHSQIYQDQFMVFIEVSTNDIYKQNQQLRISKLSWAMLQDTGFYQSIEHSLVDNFKPRTFQSAYNKKDQLQSQIINGCQRHRVLYIQKYFKNYFHCNVYGTSMRNTYYDINQEKEVQDKLKFKQNKCIKMSPNFRCLQILYPKDVFARHQPFQQCTYAECVNNTIRIFFNGIWRDMCKKQDAGVDKPLNFRSNYTFHCPSDFDAFCGEKNCENWCKKQGICIKGQCYYPQKRFEGQKIMQNLQYNFAPAYTDQNYNKVITGKICDAGCLECIGMTKFSLCKVKAIHKNSQIYNFVLCPPATKSCIGKAKNIALCFENYFFQNKRCYKCDSSCSHCQQTYGNIQMINFCKNCQEGKFTWAQTCRSCQFQNCMFCKEKGQCQTCKLNYYLATLQNSTKMCLRCLSNCGICDKKNFTNCLGCGEGAFLENNQCKPCIFFCRKCSNNSVCIQCHKGFIQRQNLCVRPCQLPCYQCALGQPSKCLSCPLYLQLNSNNHSCYVNSTIPVDYACPLGYIYQLVDSKHDCVRIPIPNCLMARRNIEFTFNSIKTDCNLCQLGFFVNQASLCQPCPQGCSRCFQIDVCEICDDGFSNPKNRDGSPNTVKCLKCVQNCLQCPASPEQCQLCSDNYQLIGTSCHSINQIQAQLTFDGNYKNFIENNKLYDIRSIILSIIDQKSKVQISKVVEGSIKVLGIVSRVFQGQVEKDCMLSYNLTNKFSNAAAESNFSLIGATFVNKISLCDNFRPQQGMQIVIYYVSAGAGVLLIVLIIIIVYLVRKLSIKEKIILKYEELTSRPQYYEEQEKSRQGF